MDKNWTLNIEFFKFVPQVDRFVNEQMQFKLQECSYNKASNF